MRLAQRRHQRVLVDDPGQHLESGRDPDDTGNRVQLRGQDEDQQGCGQDGRQAHGEGDAEQGLDAGGATGARSLFQRQLLPKGHIVLANWQQHGPGHGAEGVQLLELDAQANIVWQWGDPKIMSSLQGVLVLDGLRKSYGTGAERREDFVVAESLTRGPDALPSGSA